jgi:hypothetical protein
MRTDAQATSEAPQGHSGREDSVVDGPPRNLGDHEVPSVDDAHHYPSIQERDLQSQERYEDELIMHLERDQFVAETSRVIPRAELSTRAIAGLWALRVFVVLVGLMVVYTFVDQLH